MPQYLYAPSAVHATSSSIPSNTFNDDKWLAASQGLHREPDARHFTTWCIGGLHPSYFPAHPKTTSPKDRFEVISFLNDSIGDIFDAVHATLLLDKMLRANVSSSSWSKTALTEASPYFSDLLAIILTTASALRILVLMFILHHVNSLRLIHSTMPTSPCSSNPLERISSYHISIPLRPVVKLRAWNHCSCQVLVFCLIFVM